MNNEIEEAYKVLGLSPGASFEEVKKSYAFRCMALHPDRFPAEMKAEAEKEQLKINSAYQIIEKFLKKAGTYPPSSTPGKTESHSQCPPKDTSRREKTPKDHAYDPAERNRATSGASGSKKQSGAQSDGGAHLGPLLDEEVADQAIIEKIQRIVEGQHNSSFGRWLLWNKIRVKKVNRKEILLLDIHILKVVRQRKNYESSSNNDTARSAFGSGAQSQDLWDLREDPLNYAQSEAFAYKEYEHVWPNSGKSYVCPNCRGSCEVHHEECHATGWVNCYECGGRGQVSNDQNCPQCSGRGYWGEHSVSCGYCSGRGSVPGILTCSNCDGSGKETCWCDNGYVLCERCDATGAVIDFFTRRTEFQPETSKYKVGEKDIWEAGPPLNGFISIFDKHPLYEFEASSGGLQQSLLPMQNKLLQFCGENREVYSLIEPLTKKSLDNNARLFKAAVDVKKQTAYEVLYEQLSSRSKEEKKEEKLWVFSASGRWTWDAKDCEVRFKEFPVHKGKAALLFASLLGLIFFFAYLLFSYGWLMIRALPSRLEQAWSEYVVRSSPTEPSTRGGTALQLNSSTTQQQANLIRGNQPQTSPINGSGTGINGPPLNSKKAAALQKATSLYNHEIAILSYMINSASVALQKTTSPDNHSKGVATPSFFKVQVGLFVDPKVAKRLENSLDSFGFNSVVSQQLVRGIPYFQVWVGPFKKREMAENVSRRLTLFGYKNVMVTKSGIATIPQSGTNQQTAQGETPPAAVMEEIQNLKEEIKLDPTDASAYSSLGDLYFEATKYNHALNLYKKAVEINGSDTNYRNNLAICYHLTGQDSKAFYQLNKALKIKPNSQDLWLTLGVISYETARTMNQAGDSKTQVEHYLSLSQKALKKAYLINPSSSAGEKAEKYYKSVFK